MRFLRQSLFGLFLLSVTAGLLVIAFDMVSGALSERMAQEPRQRPQRERVFTVNVVTATPAEIAPEISVFGEIQSQRELDLRAAAGGTILAMSENFREGGQVNAGDVLVQIDGSDAEDALARARTELLAAEAAVRDADRSIALAQDELVAAQEQAALRERALQRQQDLESRGVGTAAAIETAELNLSSARQQILSRRQSVSQAESGVDQAATRLAQAQIALAEAERKLDDLQVIAEFDGTLAEVSAIQGGLVSTNERIARLIDPNALEVAFRVSTAQYARLLQESGLLRSAPVKVSLDVSGVEFVTEGVISRDSAAVGEGQTGRLVFATLNQARGLKPGDFVQVAIEEEPVRGVIKLPSAALDTQGRVMAVNSDNRLEAVPVTLLRRQGDTILVRSRELVGRQVVARLTPVLGAGIRVNAIQEGADTTPQAPPEPEMVELDEERRAKLVAFIEGNQRMPADRKQQVLQQLSQPQVPAQVVSRIEQRMGG